MVQIRFKKSIEVNSDINKIWNIISDINKIPEFWHGTREIKKINDNEYIVRFAFPQRGRVSFASSKKDYSLTENYLSGPFKGFTKNSLFNKDDKTVLTTEWNIKLSPLLALFSFRLTMHFEAGAENALDRIKKFSESSI